MVDEFYEVPVDYFQHMKITRGIKYDCLSIVSPGLDAEPNSSFDHDRMAYFTHIQDCAKTVPRLYQDCTKTVTRLGDLGVKRCLPRTLSQFQNLAIDNIAHYNHEYQFLALAFLSTGANLVLSEESHNICGRMTMEVALRPLRTACLRFERMFGSPSLPLHRRQCDWRMQQA